MQANSQLPSTDTTVSQESPVIKEVSVAQPSRKVPIFIFVVLAVLLLFVVGGGGYFLGNMNIRTAEQTLQSSVSPTDTLMNANPTATPQSSVNNADWKTYKDPDHQFQIQYPASYTLSGKLATSLETWKAGQGITLRNESHPAKPTIFIEAVYDGYGPHFPTGDLNVSFQDGQLRPSIVKKSSEDYELMVKEGLTLPNTDLYTSSVVEYNNRPYSFRISHQAHGDTTLENEMLEILSTFKFINSLSTNAIFTSFDQSLWEISPMSNAQLNSKEGCYYLIVSKVGKIQTSLQEYIEKEYNLPLKELVDDDTGFNRVWQGVEAHNLKGYGEGEVNAIYIRPGEDQIYRININSGGRNLQEYSCATESTEIPDILRGIRFN